MRDELDFRVLGPLEVEAAGVEVAVDGAIRRRVLSALLLVPGRPVSTSTLERAAWGEDPPPSARRTLQSHLSKLRSLGLPISRHADGYRIDVAADAVDAHRFRALAEAAAGPGWSRRMRDALAGWRGPPWIELTPTMVPAEALELEELHAETQELLVIDDLRRGRFVAPAEAERLVAEAPRRERRWAVLAAARHAIGRRRDALRAIADARRSLVEAGLPLGALLEQVEAELLADAPIRSVLDAFGARPDVAARDLGDLSTIPAAEQVALTVVVEDERWISVEGAEVLVRVVSSRPAPRADLVRIRRPESAELGAAVGKLLDRRPR